MKRDYWRNYIIPIASILFAVVMSTLMIITDAETAVKIEPENRCAPYSAKDYRYPADIEPEIAEYQALGSYAPYTKREVRDFRKTDIEHIVARSEAHDSGMCDRTKEEKTAFASDLLNLTLAYPKVNRCNPRQATLGIGKCAKDAAEWLPYHNQCWYVQRILDVKQKYRLSVDETEMEAILDVLEDCDSTEME